MNGQSEARGRSCLAERLCCAFWAATSVGGWALALAVFGPMGWSL